ncbi:bifunctional diguanylate cyclase/phosphodiesterase [Muricomes intestini]|uniref:Diguanylate cyclase (GGDEF)-like protein n=4 Tax=Muricomes intestini TaxID=1796634 RepID=A0A4V2UST9_9FIRM|nr:bifunctional diguanylate cyclase/phosphodiesterase [Muricomes intestini]TCS82768.1 diguanylate cyclase (GGDEF)-like protein [Muricomes intestini]
MENDFSEALLSALDEGNDIIYLSDPENYKLYYLNKKAKSALGNPPRIQWFEKLCYQVLYGNEGPCDFCPCRMFTDQTHEWQCFNKKMEKYLRGKSIAAESEGQIFHLGIAADVTEQMELENRINYLSKVDELTEAGNRKSYLNRLAQMDEQKFGGFGILVADIDRLRIVNDAYGRQWGDFILIHTAEVLKSIFEDEVYRIGEDEFIALGKDMDEAAFESVVNELTERAKWDEQFQVSMGASYYDGERDIEYHISAANEKMNLAKLYHYSEREELAAERTPAENRGKYQVVLSERLKAEIQDERFQLYLQPQINLKTGKMGGAEALVRYIDEKGNIVYPNAFIDKYESEGLIRHIDMYMLESVCRLLTKWQVSGTQEISVSVNFSRVTLAEEDIVKKMRAICDKHKVPPCMVTIEITENVGVLGRRELERLLVSLQRAGFSISLDDFGSRYSDLAILSIADFDEIKLDKSLVDKIESKGKSRTIAEYILHMCMDLELTHTVAEGIETVPQREIFKQYGCEFGQGYLFDRPMPVEDFERKYIMF